MPEIVKIQRPITPPDGPWLVYDARRARHQLVEPADVPPHVKVAMGDAHRAYFKATWSPPGGWVLTKRVADQDW